MAEENKKSWGKRAVTPLMVAFLLISFAVAVGVVIMNQGRAEVEEKAECTLDIGLSFSKIGGEEQICLERGKNQLYLSVENGINIKVEGLTVNVLGANKATTFELSEVRMEKAGVFMKYLSYNLGEFGELRQVKIIPKVKMYNNELVCPEKALVMEKIRDCKG